MMPYYYRLLATLLASYSALAQLYADDIQFYLHCSASDVIATTQVMTFIMGALGAWMSSNRLRLNSAKTQFIWLGTRQQLAHDAFGHGCLICCLPSSYIFLCRAGPGRHPGLRANLFHPYKPPASTSCANSAHCICNCHPFTCLRCKQAWLLLLALCWPPCLSTGVFGSGLAFCCPPNWRYP